MRSMLSNIKFEFKKIYSKKLIYVMIFLAFIVSYIGIYNATTPNYFSMASEIGNVNRFNYLLIENDVKDGGDWLKGTQSEDKQRAYETLVDFIPKDSIKASGQYAYLPAPSSAFFSEYIHYIDKYDVDINEAAAVDLNYSFYLTSYMEENDMDIYKEINRLNYFKEKEEYLSDYFLSQGSKLYGDIALIAIFIIATFLTAQEIESKNEYFQKLQPVKSIYIVASKYISLLSLAFAYCIFILLFSVIFAKMRGIELGLYLDFPLAAYGKNLNYMTFLNFLVSMNIAFLYRALLFIGLGILLANIFKSRLKSILFSFILIVIFWVWHKFLFSEVSRSLQLYFYSFPLNPISWNYNLFFLGIRNFASGQYNFMHYSKQISAPFVLIQISIIVLIFYITLLIVKKKYSLNMHDFSITNNSRKNLFMNELYKQVKYKSSILVISIVLVAVLLLTVNNITAHNDYLRVNMYEEGQMRSLESHIKYNSDRMDTSYEEKQLSSYKNIIKAYDSKDSKLYYISNKELEDYKKHNVFVMEGTTINTGIYELATQNISNFSKQLLESKHNWLIEKDVRPLAFDFYYGISRYDQLKEPGNMESAIDRHVPSDSSSWILLYRIVSTTPFQILMMILALLFFGANYGADLDNGNSLALLFTNPIKRENYFLTKWIVGVIRIVIFISISILIILLVGLPFGITNTLSFPVIRYIGITSNPFANMDFSKFYEIIPLYKYFLEYGALFVISFLLYYTISQLISVWLGNRWKTYAAMIIGIIGLTFLSTMINSIGVLNPLIYLDIDCIVKGEITLKYGITDITTTRVLIVFSVLTILMIIAGYILSKRKKEVI